MDAGLLWTIIGSVAGALAVVLAAWQVWLQFAEHRQRNSDRGSTSGAVVLDASGLPVVVPLGRLPAEIRGRDMLLAELRGRLRTKDP